MDNDIRERAKAEARLRVEDAITELEKTFRQLGRNPSRLRIVQMLRGNLDLSMLYAERYGLVDIEDEDAHVALHTSLEILKEVLQEEEYRLQN
jgi:hypothetical protein